MCLAINVVFKGPWDGPYPSICEVLLLTVAQEISRQVQLTISAAVRNVCLIVHCAAPELHRK